MPPKSKSIPTNPVENTFKTNHPPPISTTTDTIAGILTTIYGLLSLPPRTQSVTCLWLLHPRLETQACMAPFAAHLIHNHYNTRSHKPNETHGLIAVSFDARNHGSRLISPLANEAWRGGNEKHAQDMFSCYSGTAADVSLLLDYAEAYIFPQGRVQITRNIVLGVSLGGHAAWQVVMRDARVGTAVVCVGCPDFTALIGDRARLSRRKSWKEGFMGSADFPAGLVKAVGRWDPAGLLRGGLSEGLERTRKGDEQEDTEVDDATIVPLMQRTLGDKKILNLTGGQDKMVPYHCSKPFLDWLKRAIGKGGFFEGGGLVLEDIVFDGCGHEVPEGMVKEIARFVQETMYAEPDSSAGKRGARKNKI